MNFKPVLVLDGEWPAALTIVRSLGRRGLHIEVGSSKPDSLAAFSKFCSGHFIYPDPLVDASGFQKALTRRLQLYTYSLVIPVTDISIRPMMDIRESIESLSPLAMASNESLAEALSKSRINAIAKGLNIPIPETVVIRNLNEFHDIKEKLTYPVVIKPDSSKVWMSDGQALDVSVTYAFSLRELIEKVSKLILCCPILIQKYVCGEGVGVGVLARNGEAIVAFQYRRLHEVPLTGGPSSYRVSEPIDPTLMHYVSSLLKALCWHGVAMVEFKRDKESGMSYLMEINGRFWGSLPLAVAAGVDFPAYLYDLLVHERHDFPSTYKIGFRCRQLSKELEWLKAVIVGRKDKNPLIRFPAFRNVIIDTLRMMNPAERFDTFDLSDPRPGFYDLGRNVKRLAKSARDKYFCIKERKRMMRIRENRKPLVDKLRQAKAILIVCYGNFIRSPFAAQYLARSVMQKESISVFSAGLEIIPGRRAHPYAVTKAKSLGFDLGSHFTVPLTEKLVAKADIILTMEINHLLALNRRFSNVREKTFLLGCFSADDSLEISDPDSKHDEIFDLCFAQIIKASESIALILLGNDQDYSVGH